MRGAAVALAGAVLLAGCASMLRPPRVGPEPATLADKDAERAYQAVLERWTRRAEIYDGLDSRLFLAGTLQSWTFREARSRRVAAFRGLCASEVETLLGDERKAHAESIELVLGVHANERRWDDLARPASTWHVVLATESGEVAATSVARMTKPWPNLTALYPYLDTFWTGYTIRFPRALPGGAPVVPPQAQKVTVRVASSLGKAELRWDLDAPSAAATDWP